MDDTLPITFTETFTTPYDMIQPVDLSPPPFTPASTTALGSLTEQFYSLELLTGIVKYTLTLWSIIWDHPFMLEYFLLLMALGVFFWFAHWIIDKRRNKGIVDPLRKVQRYRRDVQGAKNWISSNPWRSD